MKKYTHLISNSKKIFLPSRRKFKIVPCSVWKYPICIVSILTLLWPLELCGISLELKIKEYRNLENRSYKLTVENKINGKIIQGKTHSRKYQMQKTLDICTYFLLFASRSRSYYNYWLLSLYVHFYTLGNTQYQWNCTLSAQISDWEGNRKCITYQWARYL